MPLRLARAGLAHELNATMETGRIDSRGFPTMALDKPDFGDAALLAFEHHIEILPTAIIIAPLKKSPRAFAPRVCLSFKFRRLT